MHPLVDAFWKGRTQFKRGTESFFDDDKKPKKACYLGAMYYGLYKRVDTKAVVDKIEVDWPQIRYWTEVPCGCDNEGGTVSSILMHLNDAHSATSWSDKKISEWLEGAFHGKAFPSREELASKPVINAG